MKKILKKILNNKFFLIFLSIYTTIMLYMGFDYINDCIVYKETNIGYLTILMSMILLYRYSKDNRSKRIRAISFVLSLFFAIVQVEGQVTKEYFIINTVSISKSLYVYMFLLFGAYTSLFYFIIKSAIVFIERKSSKLKMESNSKVNKKSWIAIAILLFILWIPYFLNYYPGITSFDTNYQLLQGFSLIQRSNHHPYFHTIVITCITKIGYKLTNSFNFGIALCSIIQMIACAMVFSYNVYYMKKCGANLKYRVAAILFFGLCPFIPQLSISIWKDIPFTLCMNIFVIYIIEIVKDANKFLGKKRNIASMMFVILLTMLFRNNGIYIIVLTLPFILVYCRKFWKKILMAFLLPIVLYEVITGPIYSALNVEKGSSREMLSIPIQQMARIAKFGQNISEEEKNQIDFYIPFEKAKMLYNPTLSDPVKFEFKEENYNSNKMGLYKLYFKLACGYPRETVQAFIGNTYGYYYPDVVTYPVATGNYVPELEAERVIDIYSNPIIKINIIDSIIEKMYDKKIPFVNLIANIGFSFWIMLVFTGFCIYKKRYSRLICYMPIYILMLTCIASPVSGELRYIYSMFICLPILIQMSVNSYKLSSEDKDEN